MSKIHIYREREKERRKERKEERKKRRKKERKKGRKKEGKEGRKKGRKKERKEGRKKEKIDQHHKCFNSTQYKLTRCLLLFQPRHFLLCSYLYC